MKIRKAIIPCGGMGTRFMPVTKAVPKEILPVVDTPVLAYIVKELQDSGIEEILIILGKGKDAIKEFFTPNKHLESVLKNKPELLATIKDINKNGEIRFGLQKEPRGSGDAVMCAREFTRDEPFCMSNGDDLIISEVPVAKQISDAYDAEKGVIIGVQKVERAETSKYGIIDPIKTNGRTVYCRGIVEKPSSENAPSQYAALGRYVLTPEIYEYIEKVKEVNGEIGLTDAICDMMNEGKAYAYEFDGNRYDMGDKFGALTATVELSLKRPDFGDKFRAYLKKIVQNAD